MPIGYQYDICSSHLSGYCELFIGNPGSAIWGHFSNLLSFTCRGVLR